MTRNMRLRVNLFTDPQMAFAGQSMRFAGNLLSLTGKRLLRVAGQSVD